MNRAACIGILLGSLELGACAHARAEQGCAPTTTIRSLAGSGLVASVSGEAITAALQSDLLGAGIESSLLGGTSGTAVFVQSSDAKRARKTILEFTTRYRGNGVLYIYEANGNARQLL